MSIYTTAATGDSSMDTCGYTVQITVDECVLMIAVMKPISVKSDSDVEDCMKQCWEAMHSCLLRITQEAKQHGDTASVLQMKE